MPRAPVQVKTALKSAFDVSLQHERQVDVAFCVADVDAAVNARLRDVEKRVAEPQQAAHSDLAAATLKLQAPRS